MSVLVFSWRYVRSGSRASQCAAPTVQTNRPHNRDRSLHPSRFACHLSLYSLSLCDISPASRPPLVRPPHFLSTSGRKTNGEDPPQGAALSVSISRSNYFTSGWNCLQVHFFKARTFSAENEDRRTAAAVVLRDRHAVAGRSPAGARNILRRGSLRSTRW